MLENLEPVWNKSPCPGIYSIVHYERKTIIINICWSNFYLLFIRKTGNVYGPCQTKQYTDKIQTGPVSQFFPPAFDKVPEPWWQNLLIKSSYFHPWRWWGSWRTSWIRWPVIMHIHLWLYNLHATKYESRFRACTR